MSHSHVRSPHQDVHGKFVHDAKKTALTANTTSHDSHATYRHTPDLESESDGEGTTSCGVPDAHTAISPPRILVSGDDSIVTGLDQTGPHVRFRSRVRISAGIGQRRRRFSDGLASGGSSISGSPSSSISAPLRTHYTGSNGWRPLGSRMKQLLASQEDADANGVGKGDVGRNGDGNTRRRRSSWLFLDDDADEHSQLLAAATRHSYAGRYVHYGYHSDDDSEREEERWWRERLVDEVFGKWPGRLLNRHWWWWHLEPIVCCFCGPDDEE